MKEWQDAHQEERLEYKRQYRQAHRGEISAYNHQYYQENIGRERARALRYRHNHLGERQAYDRLYRKQSPQMKAKHRALRKARKASLPDTLTTDEIKQIFAVRRCFYCENDAKSSLDHFIPLSKGGGTTLANSVIACKSCNSWKKDKMPEDILEQLTL